MQYSTKPRPHLYAIIIWIKVYKIWKEMTIRIIRHTQAIEYIIVSVGFAGDEYSVFAVDS